MILTLHTVTAVTADGSTVPWTRIFSNRELAVRAVYETIAANHYTGSSMDTVIDADTCLIKAHNATEDEFNEDTFDYAWSSAD